MLLTADGHRTLLAGLIGCRREGPDENHRPCQWARTVHALTLRFPFTLVRTERSVTEASTPASDRQCGQPMRMGRSPASTRSGTRPASGLASYLAVDDARARREEHVIDVFPPRVDRGTTSRRVAGFVYFITDIETDQRYLGRKAFTSHVTPCLKATLARRH
jgi:hypothetical protein